MARQVLENGVILPAEYSDDWYDDMTSNLTKLDDVIGSDSEKLSSADVGAAALSNNYNDLDNKPTIPTVNDATLTIQKNGVDVQTFTANASSNVTCNITVPTKTSDLTNDSDFVVSSSLATVATSGSYTDLDDKPTINDSTITIQKNGSTVDSFTTNGSAKTINIPVPTKTSDLTNDSNFVDTSNPAVSSGITSAKVTDYDTHIADTDIHVTTADKDRWNNQTYVFRYSSTALVASSTNSNALLDNTDNLKVGDKVIDSSGVLFSITAIDTQNSTFTIGTALIDLAQDSDVVHKSGNETISGEKTFNDLHIVSYGTQYKGARNAYILPEFSAGYSGLAITTLGFSQTLKIGNFVLDANNKPSLDASKGYIQILTGENNGVNACVIEPRNSTSSSLGATGNKWSKIYGTEYYYGSNNVEFSTKFVTTDTNQTISGAKTFSDTLTIYNNDSSQATKNLTISSSKIQVGDTSNSDSFGIVFNAGLSYVSRIMAFKDTSGTQNLQFGVRTKDGSNNTIYSMARLRLYANGYSTFEPDLNTSISLGSLSNKWSKVNGLEPSSLSLPSDRSARIDISSYITNLGNGDNNSYTVPANGYIWLHFTSINGALCYSQTSGGLTNYAQTFARYQGDGLLYAFFPVRKNDNFIVQIYTSSTAVVQSAYFIPCQGNV